MRLVAGAVGRNVSRLKYGPAGLTLDSLGRSRSDATIRPAGTASASVRWRVAQRRWKAPPLLLAAISRRNESAALSFVAIEGLSIWASIADPKRPTFVARLWTRFCGA